MDRENDLSGLLAAKLARLEAIGAMTKTLIRFARQQKTKGLLRVLNKRGRALEEIVAINAVLAKPGAAAPAANAALLEEIAAKEREIVADNHELTRAARLCYQEIKDGLRRLREHRKVRTAYDLQGINWAGRRINYCK